MTWKYILLRSYLQKCFELCSCLLRGKVTLALAISVLLTCADPESTSKCFIFAELEKHNFVHVVGENLSVLICSTCIHENDVFGHALNLMFNTLPAGRLRKHDYPVGRHPRQQLIR